MCEELEEQLRFGEETRGRGVYVDVGSSHPFHLSNTAFVDSCMGWQGLCLEPNPRLKHMLLGSLWPEIEVHQQ